MALEMRGICERCNKFLSAQSEAFICSYECTFCPTCTEEMKAACPNCGGELLRRPRRKVIAVAVAAGENQICNLSGGMEEPQ